MRHRWPLSPHRGAHAVPGAGSTVSPHGPEHPLDSLAPCEVHETPKEPPSFGCLCLHIAGPQNCQQWLSLMPSTLWRSAKQPAMDEGEMSCCSAPSFVHFYGFHLVEDIQGRLGRCLGMAPGPHHRQLPGSEA